MEIDIQILNSFAVNCKRCSRIDAINIDNNLFILYNGLALISVGLFDFFLIHQYDLSLAIMVFQFSTNPHGNSK